MPLVHLGGLLYNRAMPHATKSALLGAREGFLAGLAGRGEALRPVVHRFIANPTGRVVRAELQRRLHSLLASAQLFEEPGLVAQLQHLTARLDAVGLAGELWQRGDNDALLALVQGLCLKAVNEPGDLPLAAAGTERDVVLQALPAASSQATAQLGAVMLVRVLVVCSRPHAAALRALLDEAPVELWHAADPEQALALIEQSAPACALIAAEFAMLPDIDLVRRLRVGARPVDAVYVMLPQGASYDAEFLKQTGADGVLIEPLSWELLGPLLERAPAQLGRTQDAARQAAAEAAGFTEALTSVRTPAPAAREIADAQALSAHARATIERVRAQLAELARTTQAPSVEPARERAPRWSSLRGTVPPMAADCALRPARTGPLSGRTILVVDDDPAMRWFFSGVVRDAGAQALQARDGVEALELAQRWRPQLVLSDILMPKLDGFALRRALRADLTLERVPVLLLSWKGDAIEEVHVQGDDAATLLRKEGSAPDVLAAVEQALAPLEQLERALRAEAEVSGRVEDVGIVALIEQAVAARPNVRISVDDALGLFEIDVAESTLVAATRTAADGSFTRAVPALFQVLGVTAGRFAVRTRAERVRSPIPAPLPLALRAALRELASVIACVSGDRLDRVERVSFDEALLRELARGAPELEDLLTRLRAHAMSPRQLLARGGLSRVEVETCLRSLARRSVISGLWDSAGVDLLADAGRTAEPGAEAIRFAPEARSMPSLPPALPARGTAVAVEPWGAGASELVTSDGALRSATEAARGGDAAAVAVAGGADAELASHVTGEAERPVAEAAPAATSDDHPMARDEIDSADADRGAEPPSHGSPLLAALQDAVGHVATPVDARATAAALSLRGAAAAEQRAAPAAPEPAPRELAVDLRRLEAPAADVAVARRQRREGLQLALTLAASAVFGYLAALQIETHPALWGHASRVIGTRGVGSPLTAAVDDSETSVRSGLDPAAGLGTVLPYIDTTRGVPVGSDEGLVIFEYVGAAPAPSLEIDDRVLGVPPLAVPLAARPHQLKLRFAGDAILRTLTVRAGETRVITLPLSKP